MSGTPPNTHTPTGTDWWPEEIPFFIGVAPVDSDIEIRGAVHTEEEKILEVAIVACKNSTDQTEPVCRSPEEIRDYVHGSTMNMMDHSMDYPKAGPAFFSWTLMLGQTKQVTLWYKRRNLTITAKHPLETDEEYWYWLVNGVTEQIATEWGDGTLAVMSFKQEKHIMVERHMCASIVDLAGAVGGNWASLVSVFGAGAFAFNRWKLGVSIEKLRERSRIVEDLHIASSSNRQLHRREFWAGV